MESIVKLIRPYAVFALCCTTLAAMPQAWAESARYIDLQGFSRLLEGDAVSTSLSEDGAIGLSLTAHDRYVSAAAQVGASCLYRDEIITVQSGETPKLVAISPHGRERALATDLTGRMVTRLGVHAGNLVVALAPKPELLLLGPSGQSQTIPVPDVGFVWDMLTAPDGSLIVATGEPGRIMKLGAKNTWQTLFEAQEAHIKNLAYDKTVGLVAGGGQKGIVYHGDLSGNMRALFDSGNTEITALAIEGDAIFAASVTGAQAALSAPGDSAGTKGAPELQSRVVRLGLDGTSELLAGSNDEVIFDLVSEKPGSVLLATGAAGRKDARGRLYRLNTARRSIALLHQSASRRLVRLHLHPSGELLVVGQEGTRITELTNTPKTAGVYVSPTFDTGINSTFGAIQALGDFPKGTQATLSVRTGQTSEPDNSWSPWSKDTNAICAQVSGAPPGRYAQARLTLRGTASAKPEVLRLRMSYLRQNLAPFIRDFGPMDKGIALAALPSSQGQEEQRTKIVVLAERDDSSSDAGRKQPARARQSQERGALTIRWLADDANGDDLESTLWMRPLGDERWQLLAAGITDTFYTLQSSQLADGHYLFRVRVSDVRSNPIALARQDERVSRAVLVDNTPPVFDRLAVQIKKGRAKLTGEVSDAVGLITSLQVAVDGGPLRPWQPQDGVLDGPKERLDGDLGAFLGGTHTLTLVAQDEAQNEAYATLRFEVPAGAASAKK